MEEFKKELFLEDNKFAVPVSQVTVEEKNDIERFINSKLKNKACSFFTGLKDILTNSKSYNSLESSATIERACRDLRLLEAEIAIIIWNYPDDVDKMQLRDIIRYWENIWFSSSDEAAAIFFPVQRKIILITHYNNVYY